MLQNRCINTLINSTVKWVYQLLYHQFAFTYDLAAWMVSWGHWVEWTRTALPYINGARVLELGCGPGHLLVTMARNGLYCCGVDESKQMCLKTSKKIYVNNDYAHCSSVVRSFSQSLPFLDNSFSSIISSFPSNYIFDPKTLSEISRVLVPGGNLIIVLTAVMKKNLLWKWVISRLFYPPLKGDDWQSLLISPLKNSNLIPQVNWVDFTASQVMVINANNSKSNEITH